MSQKFIIGERRKIDRRESDQRNESFKVMLLTSILLTLAIGFFLGIAVAERKCEADKSAQVEQIKD